MVILSLFSHMIFSKEFATFLQIMFGGSAGFVDEDEPRRIELEMAGEPVPTLLQNVRALLLLGMRGLFLNVMLQRSKKRHSGGGGGGGQLATRRSCISSSVMCGARRMRPSR